MHVYSRLDVGGPSRAAGANSRAVLADEGSGRTPLSGNAPGYPDGGRDSGPNPRVGAADSGGLGERRKDDLPAVWKLPAGDVSDIA